MPLMTRLVSATEPSSRRRHRDDEDDAEVGRLGRHRFGGHRFGGHRPWHGHYGSHWWSAAPMFVPVPVYQEPRTEVRVFRVSRRELEEDPDLLEDLLASSAGLGHGEYVRDPVGPLRSELSFRERVVNRRLPPGTRLPTSIRGDYPADLALLGGGG